jgi:hypothetical protein
MEVYPFTFSNEPSSTVVGATSVIEAARAVACGILLNQPPLR